MHQLNLTRQINKPVAQVFKAWTQPEMMRRWFAPGDMHVPDIAVDFRVGGRYRIVMQNPAGEQHIVVGEYLDIQNERLIAFSWQWEGSPVLTKVAVNFRSLESGGSELELVHSEFADIEARDRHAQGWAGCLANFESLLAA